MYDVVIIGGGLSGLAAAVELARKKLSIALVEQAPRLGGRCYSYTDAKTGDVIDNGQHVLLGAYKNLLRYLDTIGTRSLLKKQQRLRLPFFHPTKGRGVFEMLPLPEPLHLTAGLLKFKLLSLADRQRLLKVGMALRKWDSQTEQSLAPLTVDQWLVSLRQSAEARRSFWNPIALSVMNETSDRSSALLFAKTLRVAFLGKKEESAVLIPTVGQTDLYVTGAMEILRKHGARVILNSGAECLAVGKSRADGVRLGDGSKLHARHIIAAIPPFALKRILPGEYQEHEPFSSLEKFEYSPIVSLHLWFDKHFMDVEFLGIIDRTLQWVFDRRLIAGTTDKPTGHVSAVISGARDFVELSKDKLIALTIRDLHETFPASRKARLLHSVIIKEKRATFSPVPGIESHRPGANSPISNLYLAGDWTDTGYPATVEGAVMSGFEASKMVMAAD